MSGRFGNDIDSRRFIGIKSMPQLLIIGAVIIAGWYAWRVLKREMARVDREVEAVRKRPTETLTRDPESGRYRVKDKG
jgi:hypothetical protein